MALKRTRRQAKRPGGYKRRRAMRGRVPRTVRPGPNSIMNMRRRYYAYSWTPGTAAVNDFWRNNFIQFNNIPNFQEVTNLYDYYRIRAIKFSWFPRSTQYNGADTTDTTAPGITNSGVLQVVLMNDNKSAITPAGTYTSATLNNLLEQDRTRLLMGHRPIHQYNRAVYQDNFGVGGGATAFKAGTWISTNNITVPHFVGQIFVYDSNFSGFSLPANTLDCYITVYFQVKGLR